MLLPDTCTWNESMQIFSPLAFASFSVLDKSGWDETANRIWWITRLSLNYGFGDNAGNRIIQSIVSTSSE